MCVMVCTVLNVCNGVYCSECVTVHTVIKNMFMSFLFMSTFLLSWDYWWHTHTHTHMLFVCQLHMLVYINFNVYAQVRSCVFSCRGYSNSVCGKRIDDYHSFSLELAMNYISSFWWSVDHKQHRSGFLSGCIWFLEECNIV